MIKLMKRTFMAWFESLPQQIRIAIAVVLMVFIPIWGPPVEWIIERYVDTTEAA